MAVSRATTALLLLAAWGCSKGDEPRPAESATATATAPAPSPIAVEVLSVDTLDRPRDQRPYVAGESIRIGLSVVGGRGPYRARVRAADAAGRFAIDADTELPVAADGTAALAAALRGDAASGEYRLTVELTDRHGAVGRAAEVIVPVVGEGAEHIIASAPLHVVDAGGRRRARFYAGESIIARGAVPGAAGDSVRIQLWDSAGVVVADGSGGTIRDGRVEVRLAIPRLSPSGRYRVRLTPAGGAGIEADFEVEGPSFAPVEQLTVESLTLRGGPDGRAAVGARLDRAHPLVVEARVAGARTAVETRVRWHHAGGRDEVALAPTQVRHRGARARTLVAGSIDVPKSVRSGRVHLEIEVTEGERVSSIYREMLVE